MKVWIDSSKLQVILTGETLSALSERQSSGHGLSLGRSDGASDRCNFPRMVCVVLALVCSEYRLAPFGVMMTIFHRHLLGSNI